MLIHKYKEFQFLLDWFGQKAFLLLLSNQLLSKKANKAINTSFYYL